MFGDMSLLHAGLGKPKSLPNKQRQSGLVRQDHVSQLAVKGKINHDRRLQKPAFWKALHVRPPDIRGRGLVDVDVLRSSSDLD